MVVRYRNSQWVIEHLVALAHFPNLFTPGFFPQLETKHTEHLTV